MKDLLRRQKSSAECLSDWQVSQLALDLLPEVKSTPAKQHVSHCARCQNLVDQHMAETKAAAYTALPSFIRQEQGRPAERQWPWFTSALACGAATLVLLVLFGPRGEIPDATSASSTTRSKGSPSLQIAVKRGERVVAKGVSLDGYSDLKAGDRIRFRVVDTKHRFVLLQGEELGQWVDYYSGAVPSGGWLEVGVELTPGKSRLRYVGCNKQVEQARLRQLHQLSLPKQCHLRVYELGELQ